MINSDKDSTNKTDVSERFILLAPVAPTSIIYFPSLIAGILLIINNDLWIYFGLVGGGIYLCFTGRGIASRLTMQRRGINIGSSKNLKVNYIFLTFWGLIALITIIMAIATLTL